MKSTILVFWLIVLNSACSYCQNIRSNFPDLKGPYLGLNPPGNVPQLFAPGIVSRDGYFEHNATVFSPDGTEVYWSGKPNGARYFEISFMKMVDGKWTAPKVVLSHKEYSFDHPVLSADGNTLFFESRSDIWCVNRNGEGWTEPARLSSIINSEGSEGLRSVTNDGSIYFSRFNPNESNEASQHEIFVSRRIGDTYITPEKLDKHINRDDGFEFSAFVAPDERYMIFESSKDRKSSSLYICFKMKDGLWSESVKLPFKGARFPTVSPDGKYLFFITSDEGIWWVNASFIDELRPHGF